MSYAHLNPQRAETVNPDNHLTPGTFPAIAQRLLRAGMYTNFASLISGQAGKPDMMATIKPAWVAKAAAGMAADGMWGSYAQLVCAFRDRPQMMTKFKPADIRSAAGYMLAPDGTGNAKAHGLNGMKAYIDLLEAVSAHPKLMAVFAVEDVDNVAKTIAQAMSHVYNRNPDYGRKVDGHVDDFHTMYYPDKVEKFVALANVVKKDASLSLAIDPADVKAAALALFHLAEEKVKEHQTDERYPVELPHGFGGFKPLGAFLQSLIDAPESWRTSAAGLAKNLVRQADDRSVPHIARIINKVPYLMSVADFHEVVDGMDGNSHAMARFLHAFKNVAHLKTAYPAAIPQLMRAEFKDWERLDVREAAFPGHEQVVVRTAGEMLASLADGGDYARMSRLSSQLSGDMARAGRASLSARDLYTMSFYAGWMGDTETYDQDFGQAMGRRSFLDIVFRRAAGDTVVCVDNNNESGYRIGGRPARVVVNPVQSTRDVDGAPEGLAPAISMAFHKAVALADKTPEWVQQIAQKVLAVAPAP